MHTSTIVDRPEADRTGAPPSRPRGRILSVAAAAVIIAVVVGVSLFQPDESLSPAAALTQAAQNTGAAVSLRSEYRQQDLEGGFNVVRSEHDGRDLRRSFSSIAPDGTEQPSVDDEEYIVFIGDQGWTAVDGPTTVDPAERNAPYAVSSAAIVEAATTGTTVTDVGDEDVRGVEATHYRVAVDDGVIARLGELPANQLSAFELEAPQFLESLDVWVADDQIRRIEVTLSAEAGVLGATAEFYDFGADITITPPR